MSLVIVETEAQLLSDVSKEALTFARELNDAVEAVHVGDLPTAVASTLAAYGVSLVHVARHEALGSYAAAASAAAVAQALAASGAEILVAPGSPRGNEVLAHVAARTEAPMAANVVAVQGRSPLVVTRQVMGGAVLEDMSLDAPLAALSVAGHAVEAREANSPGEAQIREFSPQITDSDLRAMVTRIEVSDEAADMSRLTRAKVVVGAGRGAGGPEGFGDVVELADLLGGALGVSRVVTSLGWRPHHEQVGQTGSRISPELYIPCGISGAIQHWAGCSSSQTILAINTDPDAPMVTRAQYAVIGDMHEILPAIIEELRRR